ncbi:MAG: hypothetical protein R3338_00485, partial [Thermoanaerobaculia bacterium]|nr:hypothetical protein [Thermoanaerobaculia bacterium]
MKKNEFEIRRFIEPELAASTDILLVADADGEIVRMTGESEHVPLGEKIGSTLELLDSIVSSAELLDDLRNLDKHRVISRRLIPLADEGVLLLSSLP